MGNGGLSDFGVRSNRYVRMRKPGVFAGGVHGLRVYFRLHVRMDGWKCWLLVLGRVMVLVFRSGLSSCVGSSFLVCAQVGCMIWGGRSGRFLERFDSWITMDASANSRCTRLALPDCFMVINQLTLLHLTSPHFTSIHFIELSCNSFTSIHLLPFNFFHFTPLPFIQSHFFFFSMSCTRVLFFDLLHFARSILS